MIDTQIEKNLGSEPAWLKEVRAAADSRFKELGFPTPQQEDWRFTNVAPIVDSKFAPAPRPLRFDNLDARKLSLCLLEGPRLVFVNGHYAPALSSTQGCAAGVRVESLAALLKASPQYLEPYLTLKTGAAESFSALNTSLFRDGAVIRLGKDAVCRQPIHLLFISTEPAMALARVLVVAEAGAQASIVEEYVSAGTGASFTNAFTEIRLGENSKINHYKIGRENEKAFHVGTTQVAQERDSLYTSHSLTLGGALVRNNLNVLLAARGAECALNGLYMVGGRRHVDNHTLIDHATPHTTSSELYKGVLDGESRAVFNGTIIVRPDAQKTNSRQSNKNLVLSEGGLVNTKPEFKIYANDVQCKHGATIGQLSPDALFYLRSRGIDPQPARQLLVYAFISEMVGLMELAPLKEALIELLSEKLPGSLN